jgi:hypothetical protein
MDIKIGSKLSCNWGAMHPTEVLTITKIKNGRVWADSGFTVLISDIRDLKKEYRSPIGVWLI